MSYSTAVAADLERDIGVKPGVGFNCHNGNLQSVTVTFPKVYVGKPLDELAGTVREVVAREFKQTPQVARRGGRPGLKLRDPGVVSAASSNSHFRVKRSSRRDGGRNKGFRPASDLTDWVPFRCRMAACPPGSSSSALSSAEGRAPCRPIGPI